MNRSMVVLAGLMCWAAPAASQWAGFPVWNTPGGARGVVLLADYGRPDTDGGKGHAFGARAALGLGTLTLSAGLAAWKPDSTLSGGTDWISSFGGTAALRLVGGSLLPVALNVQVGAGRSGEAGGGFATVPQVTILTLSAGVSTMLPAPGLRIEPFVSPGVRHYIASGENETNFGWVIGATLDFARFGLHVAYDWEEGEGVLGAGIHVGLGLR